MAKCAPINCHFVLAPGGGKECMSTNKLANVSGQLFFHFKSAARGPRKFRPCVRIVRRRK